MKIYKTKKTEFINFIKNFSDEKYDIFAPEKIRDKFAYKKLSSEKDLKLNNYTLCVYSPKFILFPSYEKLLNFKKNEFRIEFSAKEHKALIIGVRPCEMASINLLDKVFSKDPQDENYLHRRENTVIIQMDCLKKCSEFSFCSNTDTFINEEGFDIALTEVGEDFLIRVNTAQGESILKKLNKEEQSEKEYSDIKSSISKYFENLREYDISNIKEKLENSYNSKLWKEESELCFSCGTCNFVCPTCYCFNIKDNIELDFNSGERGREWDGCMMKNFAIVAGKENFRKEKHQRLRHRIFRKGLYPLEEYKKIFCTGCGRCIQNCLVRIDINKIFKKILKESDNNE